jgi:hypothetical protein
MQDNEAAKICYAVGWPVAAIPFVQRMLDLERQVQELLKSPPRGGDNTGGRCSA